MKPNITISLAIFPKFYLHLFILLALKCAITVSKFIEVKPASAER